MRLIVCSWKRMKCLLKNRLRGCWHCRIVRKKQTVDPAASYADNIVDKSQVCPMVWEQLCYVHRSLKYSLHLIKMSSSIKNEIPIWSLVDQTTSEHYNFFREEEWWSQNFVVCQQLESRCPEIFPWLHFRLLHRHWLSFVYSAGKEDQDSF